MKNEIIKCPKCKSKDIRDHDEFGLPGGYRYRCCNCGYLWIIK